MSTLTVGTPIKPTLRASLWALHSGTTVAKWTFPPKSGAIPAKSGPGSRRSSLSTGSWTWPILTCRSLLYFREEAYRYPKGYDEAHPVIDRVGLQGDAMTVVVCTENDHISEDVRLFREALSRDGELLGERMRLLASLLKEMGY